MGAAIVRARLRRVKIPLRMVYVSSMYVMTDTTRTVIELFDDEGRVGLGEAHGTEEVFRAAEVLARNAIGLDPADRRALQHGFARSVFDNRQGRAGWSSAAGVELAMWDLLGRQTGLSFGSLLGGGDRIEPIELVCPVPALVLERPESRSVLSGSFGDLGRVGAVVDYAVDHAGRYGFGCFKYKSAAVSADFDVAVMTALRKALPDARLRFDPNAGYPPAEAIALCRRMDSLGLEFFEDPTDDQEGLARLRGAVSTPVATNMCVIQIDHLAAAIRSRPADVILADLYLWGGVLRFTTMLEAATAAGFEVAIHSLFETGIGTAANLHLGAAFPEIRRANDSGLHVLSRDVVHPALRIAGGAMTVPPGPGLGVALDEDALADVTIQSAEVGG